MGILTSRKRKQPTLQQRIEATRSGEGVEVVILVRGPYNGPNHKTLGVLEPGALVRVAANGYADSLIADGFACRPDDLIDEDEFADLVENMTSDESVVQPPVVGVTAKTDVEVTEADEPEVEPDAEETLAEVAVKPQRKPRSHK